MRLEDEQARLAGVSYVVLDEFHYMNDPSRGTVCCTLLLAYQLTSLLAY